MAALQGVRPGRPRAGDVWSVDGGGAVVLVLERGAPHGWSTCLALSHPREPHEEGRVGLYGVDGSAFRLFWRAEP